MDNEQEYITITQVASKLGWNKATVYDWIKTLEIQTHRFVRNRNTFLHIDDFERLKEVKEKPWTAGPNTARTARRVSEKVEKPPTSPPVVQPTEKVEKRVYNRKEKDTGLPDGAMLAIDFARAHNVKRETFRDHMLIGLGPGSVWGQEPDPVMRVKDHVDYSEREKPGRAKEKERYLTADQQSQALAFWQRHKVDYSQCNRAECPCKGE